MIRKLRRHGITVHHRNLFDFQYRKELDIWTGHTCLGVYLHVTLEA